MADKLTVFQRLGRVLGGEANTPTYIIDPKSFSGLEAVSYTHLTLPTNREV